MAALLAGIRARDASILGITDLDLTGCGLEELPTEVCELTRLEKLNLGGNNLADLPDAFSALVSLLEHGTEDGFALLSLSGLECWPVVSQVQQVQKLEKVDTLL